MKNKVLRHIGGAAFIMLLGASLVFSACGSPAHDSPNNTSSTNATPLIPESDMFTNRDLDPNYNASNAIRIAFESNGIKCDSNAVSILGSKITIKKEGVYLVSGSLENGMIIVDAGKTDKIQLVLDDVSISASDSAAIYAVNADKLFITLAEGSQNNLTGCDGYKQFDENNIDAVIFSKCDLTLNGSGLLAIDAPVGHGIVSKDDLVIASGFYEIRAASHGFSGNDSIRVASGSISVVSGKDALHSENTNDASRGFIYIADGSFDIDSAGDGLSASNSIMLQNGHYDIVSGSGSDAAQGSGQGIEDLFPFGRSSGSDSTSTKGIKADGNIEISAGIITIDSCDDSLHAGGNISFSNASLTIKCGDDALHADENIAISSGTIDIPVSHEGIEGHRIDISGGNISIKADDDGINAAGGNDQSGFGGFGGDRFSGSSDAYIHISGGWLSIDSDGDGVDSNGSIIVSGGETYISGPVDGANGAIDYSMDATITGGTFVAVGSRQMAMGFSDSSTQGSMLVGFDTQQSSADITLLDSNGNSLIEWKAEKSCEVIVISCPSMTVGSTYCLTVGSYSANITLDSIVYHSAGMAGGGMGGHGGGFPGGNGRPNDAGHPNFSDRPDGMGRPDAGGRPDSGSSGGFDHPGGSEFPGFKPEYSEQPNGN